MYGIASNGLCSVLFRFRILGKWRTGHCVHQTECERDLLLNSKFIRVRRACVCPFYEKQQQTLHTTPESLSCSTFSVQLKWEIRPRRRRRRCRRPAMSVAQIRFYVCFN